MGRPSRGVIGDHAAPARASATWCDDSYPAVEPTTTWAAKGAKKGATTTSSRAAKGAGSAVVGKAAKSNAKGEGSAVGGKAAKSNAKGDTAYSAGSESETFETFLAKLNPEAWKGSLLSTKASASIMAKLYANIGVDSSTDGVATASLWATNTPAASSSSAAPPIGNGTSYACRSAITQPLSTPSKRHNKISPQKLTPPSAASATETNGSLGVRRLGLSSQDADDDDDEEANQRWLRLFAKGSPLAEGTARDPFREDPKSRAQVVWKKGQERKGHHSRYQERRYARQHDLAARSEVERETEAHPQSSNGMVDDSVGSDQATVDEVDPYQCQ